MALIQCNECGAMISDQALTCPSCGSPTEFAKAQQLASEHERQLKSDKRKQMWRKILTITYIIGLLGIIVCTCIWLPFEASRINVYERGLRLFEEHIIVVYALIVGFGLFCWLLAKNKPKNVKIYAVFLFAIYTASVIAYLAYYNIAIHKPHQEFLSKYQSANIAKNLQGTKLAWGNSVVITIEDNTVNFEGDNVNLTLPIDSISDYGRIFIDCDVNQLKKAFGNRYNGYFYLNKVEDMRTSCPKSRFIISAYDHWNDGYGFEISYDGYYSERVSTGTRYTNSQFGMMAIPSTKQVWYHVGENDMGYLRVIQ